MLRNISTVCRNKIFHLWLSVFILSFAGAAAGQESRFSTGIWHHQSLSLKLAFEALQRNQKVILQGGALETPKIRDISGDFVLSSRGFLWHPNFLTLNLDAQYRPARKDEEYLFIPDRSEVRTAESYRVQGILFQRRVISLGGFNNYAHSFVNRELVSNIETFSTGYGGNLSLRWRALPLKISYRNTNWKQTELDFQREFINKNSTWEAEFSKSFTDGGDEHQLRITRDDFSREYEMLEKVRNIGKIADFRSNIPFGGETKSNLLSNLNYYDQSGSNPFQRVNVTENLRVDLPKNFDVSSNFNYLRFRQTRFKSDKTGVLSQVKHRLFESLQSLIYHEWSKTSQFEFSELYNTAGINFEYSKKVPSGQLQLTYKYEFRQQDRDAQPTRVQIVDEEQQLDDGKTILLENPFVDVSTVVITDNTGTIIYQENFDYLLIQRGSFVEVRRLPGGQIQNNQSVFIDYVVLEQGAFRFDQISEGRGASLSLLNHVVEGYYREYQQDYQNAQTVQPDYLKFVNQRVLGVKVDFGVLSGGYERDDFESNIVPYESERFYAAFHHTFSNKLNLILTGSKRDFYLVDDRELQKFWDASGRVAYFLTRNTRLTLESGYRVQRGFGIDLDLVNFKGELRARYRQLEFIAGAQVYRRVFINETNNYDGVYLRVERTFW